MQPCKVVQPKAMSLSQVHAAVTAQSKVLKRCMEDCENGVSGEGKKVDYDVLAHRTQMRLLAVTTNLARAEKGLPPLQ